MHTFLSALDRGRDGTLCLNFPAVMDRNLGSRKRKKNMHFQVCMRKFLFLRMRTRVNKDSKASSSLRQMPLSSSTICVTWSGVALPSLELCFSTCAMRMWRLRSPKLKGRLVRWPSTWDGCGPQTPHMTFTSSCFQEPVRWRKSPCPSGSCHLHRAFQALRRVQTCLSSEQSCFLRLHVSTRRSSLSPSTHCNLRRI